MHWISIICNIVAIHAIIANMDSKLSSLLRQFGYSATITRTAIFESLATKESPLTMAELVKSVSTTVDRATVYRTIDIFEKAGIVNRIQIGWKYKLELSDIFQQHHHHIRCSDCGKIETFHETEQLLSELDSIAKAKLFKLKSHTLELSGLCSECSKH